MDESSPPRTRIRTIIVFSLLFAILGAVVVFAYFSTFSRPLTTVILVRHAEKKIEPTNPDPDLTPAGESRAQELARVFGNAGITKIFATQFKRTQQTAKPLSDRSAVPITVLDAQQTSEVVKQILSNRGGTIFVAGHNNTVPAIVSEFTGENVPVIPESEYDNMFIVTIYRFGKAKVLKIKYGAESTPGQGTGTMVPLPQ